MDELLKALHSVQQRFEPTLVPDAKLGSRLQRCQEIAMQLSVALAQEESASTESAKVQKLVADLQTLVAALSVRLKRVESAQEIVNELLAHQSQAELTERVLRENAAHISATFAAIHSPNEFEIVANGKFEIVRRANGTGVTLDEMSSGQRAAFALSLFLAMNSRLHVGPRVLIFDDPVAHVDDINTLSFLDHLRAIALTGRRQIFFATANSKLAGLFAHKFRFLGPARFKTLQLTRES